MSASLSSHASALSGTYTPTPLQIVNYGPGSISTLPELVHKLAAPSSDSKAKVLIVTGNSLADKTGVITDIQAILEKEGIASIVFKGIGQHAPIAGIRDAVKIVTEKRCTVLVSVGGGSPIDAAKAISYFVKEETKSSSFMPQIAIPTTLSAAEFTANAGYSNDAGDKIGVSDPQIVPKAIILDANLSLHTPQNLWLSTGIRALDHAIETLYRRGSQTPLKHLALASIKELFICLPLCKERPDDVEVRQRLQVAAWESLWPNALPGAIGLSHALGHKLGATYSIPHGICSCFTLPGTILLLSRTLPPSSWELASLASALPFIPARFLTSHSPDLVTTPSTATTPHAALGLDAWKVGKAVENLVRELELFKEGKERLRDYNVTEEDLRKVAEGAVGGLKGWVAVGGEGEEVKKGVLEGVW